MQCSSWEGSSGICVPIVHFKEFGGRSGTNANLYLISHHSIIMSNNENVTIHEITFLYIHNINIRPSSTAMLLHNFLQEIQISQSLGEKPKSASLPLLIEIYIEKKILIWSELSRSFFSSCRLKSVDTFFADYYFGLSLV